MKTHELKTLPEYFELILSGQKTFELRRNDRVFSVGDELLLREFRTKPILKAGYTGRDIRVLVTSILRIGNRFDADDPLGCVIAADRYEWVIMSIKKETP